MGSRDRDTKSLQDKLKVFFKKGAAGRGEPLLTPELERELAPGAPLPRRLRAARELAERAAAAPPADGGAERVWRLARDLLDEGGEARAAALALLRATAPADGPLRSVLLRWLRESRAAAPPADEPLRFRLLHALTDAGRNIACFEEDIGPFLLEWLPDATSPQLLVELLQLITNVVKFNASSLDEDVVQRIVECACVVCCSRAAEDAVGASLALLEAVAAYSLLPRGALRTLVAALARTVNVETHAPAAWKLMRCVLGADIGHAALHETVQLLRADDADAGLARGCVFFVHMALWGPRRVPALRPSYLAALPALLAAVQRRQAVVTYEVVVALQALVTRAPGELHEPAWDAVLRVLRAAHELDEALEPPNEPLHSRLHAVVGAIEQLHMANQWTGDADALLDLVDAMGHARPEASAMWLVSARCAALTPWGAGAAGPAGALALAERYVRGEARLAVRLHALQQLVAFVLRHRHVYGDELVERVGAPVAGACAADAEPALRAAAARALTDMARATSADATTDLIDLLERILNRPFEMYVTDVAIPADADVSDLRLAARGLLELLHDKLLRAPAAHAARAFLVLLEHAEHHYRRPTLFMHHPDIRLLVFDMIFGLRANRFNCVGFCYDAAGAAVYGAAALRLRPVCSPLLSAEGGRGALPVGRAARLLGAALARERDWAVLAHVLRALPPLLQARALAVGRRAQDIDLLASTLCAMLSDRNFPEGLRAAAGAGRPTLSELHGLALPPLAAMAPYHAYLEPQTQQRIVRCLLKYGMVLRCPAPYITALTLFALETRDTMVKMLPEVLLDLSKISDTKLIASPMLEFLSTLTRLPRVFASFVEDQYMSVFAILLPYTNPSRYNHYVVSLAHHVVAAWFLKCRLAYRRNFVRFIIHGLHNYIIMPFEEQLGPRGVLPAPANEDSSNRQRSSSLGSRMVPRAPRPAAAASAAFHVELTETCVDLLSRYAFTPCSVKPQRSDVAEFMFSGGQSCTWLVGHRLVTITTSGCQQNALKQGLCERCAALCRHHADSVASPLPPAAPDPAAGPSRQGSGEGDPVTAALNHLAARLERTAREVEGEEGGWSRVGALGGGCPCWCAGWAQVHVRSPTGDVAWLMRMQNDMSFDYMLESPLQEVAALLAAPAAPVAALRPPRPADVAPDMRARSNSASERGAADLHKSSSDTVVAGPGAAAAARRTQPIDIPGSPQRQSSSSTTDDDDMLLAVPSGKSRHPVRRSNSSPEMSTSWKLGACEPEPAESAAATLHASKKAAKKTADTRVSCEAIPEEMSGTSPLQPPAPPPPLLTLRSDPGQPRAQDSTTSDETTISTHDDTSHDRLQKTASEGSVGGMGGMGGGGGEAGAGRSRRSNTISVMSPARRRRGAAPAGGGGVTPAFVFLQLYHNMSTLPTTPPVPGEPPPSADALAERPLRVAGPHHERTIKNLDLVPPIETYEVGVLYVGPGQHEDEVAIMRNEHGSVRYGELLARLGALVALDAAPRPGLFLNLDTGGRDGRYTYVWTDDVMQVQFHVATAMPRCERDPSCNEKRKYIGNDYVSIVYNDSGQDFNIHTIKGQLNFCIVVVEPLEHGLNRVAVKTKDERVRSKFLAHQDAVVVSDASVALLARQLALHCALAAHISQSLRPGGAPYASNALERLRLIKLLRRRAAAERAAAARPPEPYAAPPDLHRRVAIDDFIDYT